MAHVHTEEDAGTYYLEQLCTLAACGALAMVGVLLWWRGQLTGILHERFHQPVLWGSITLLVLIAFRAVALWFSAGKPMAGHEHVHDHSHDHDHGCCHHDDCNDDDHEHGIVSTPAAVASEHLHEHNQGDSHGHTHSLAVLPSSESSEAHGHGHDHGWAPWRYVLLMLPVVLCVLFFLLDPIRGGLYGASTVDVGQLEATTSVAVEDGEVNNLGFLELQQASYTAGGRYYWEGKVGRLRGQFVAGRNEHEFSLARFKISCCAADAIQLNAVILSPESINVRQLEGKWVEVVGAIQFRKRTGREEYVAVLTVLPKYPVREVEPDSNPYLY